MAHGTEKLTGIVLDGKYKLTRLLGVGGMGAVYEAEHTVITRKVAVKVLHRNPDETSEAAQRFIREARTASAIEHQNVVEIFDVGLDPEGIHYIVMELLKGELLSDYMGRHERIPAPKALPIFGALLAGLRAAHEAGIVHRDLKPSNVFLALDQQGARRVKLLDFGISKQFGPDTNELALTASGAVMGTPLYMSPEQARGERDLDSRTDVWSAAVILYQMLAGQVPFQGDSYNQVMSNILVEPVPQIRELVPDLPAELVSLLDSALTKDRKRRFAAAGEFAAALANLGLSDDAGSKSGSLDLYAPTVAATVTDESALASGVSGSPTGTAENPPSTSTAEALQATPLAKRIAWYALTLPMAWLTVFMLLQDPDQVAWSLFSIYGLPVDSLFAVAAAIAIATSIVLTSVAGLVERFWLTGRTYRFLQGDWFVVFPLAAFVGVYRCHEVFSGRIQVSAASFRIYTALDHNQIRGISGLLGEAFAQYLNTVGLSMLQLTALAYIVMLGHLFARVPKRPEHTPAAARRPWMVGAGLAALVLVAEVPLMFFTLQSGVWRLLVYLLMAVTALAMSRQARRKRGRSEGAWRSLQFGVCASLALAGLSTCVGLIVIYESLDDYEPLRRAMMLERSGNLVLTALLALAVWVAAAATVCMAAFRAHLAGSGAERIPHARRSLAIGATAVVLVLLPAVTMISAHRVLTREMDLAWARPGIAEMIPGTHPEDESASFYVDRHPASLGRGATDFFLELTGRCEHSAKLEDVVARLAGGEVCAAELLASAESTPEQPVPARCLSAIEARVYCQVRGKRLATPEEWDAAIASLPVEIELAGDGREPHRGPFGEWVMTMSHGTPTFEVKGRPGGLDIPEKPRADSVFRQVGFRCAYRFED